MQKISPLRSGLEAFKKFKIERTKTAENKNASASTNPFGITFKGTVLQMDVFESSKKVLQNASIKDKLQSVGKWTASAFASLTEKTNSTKEAIIARFKTYANNIKDFINKLNTTNVEFDLFKYNVSNLQKRPVAELQEMLKSELAVGV